MEMYFFHIVPTEQKDSKLSPYLFWSTYKVQRNFVKIPKIKFRKKMNYSNKLQSPKIEQISM